MQTRRDSSVLRSLALSFGEGLAFSVGTKLAQNAIRPANAAEAPDFAPIAARLEQIEQRIAKAERPRGPQQFDQRVIHAIVNALETRMQEQSASLREEVKEMHREFAVTVANVVGEQVAQRMAEVETRLQERVASAVAPLEAELAELRGRVAETENTMAEFVSAISLMCRKAAERDESAPEPEPSVAASTGEPVLDLPIPAFAQVRKVSGIWRVPVASSFLLAFTAAGLLMRDLLR